MSMRCRAPCALTLWHYSLVTKLLMSASHAGRANRAGTSCISREGPTPSGCDVAWSAGPAVMAAAASDPASIRDPTARVGPPAGARTVVRSGSPEPPRSPSAPSAISAKNPARRTNSGLSFILCRKLHANHACDMRQKGAAGLNFQTSALELSSAEPISVCVNSYVTIATILRFDGLFLLIPTRG